MNNREAILKAAAHIESHPHQYLFISNDKPSCGTPGCMLGWVGVFCEVREDPRKSWATTVAHHLGLSGIDDFIGRFEQLKTEMQAERGKYFSQGIPSDAAEILRCYANKYYPASERNFARELMASLPKAPIPSEAV